MHDQLADGRMYRLLNVIDDYRREGMTIEQTLFAISAFRPETGHAAGWRNKPVVVRCEWP
jgi:putative transposase